jgi:hypothetical protein
MPTCARSWLWALLATVIVTSTARAQQAPAVTPVAPASAPAPAAAAPEAASAPAPTAPVAVPAPSPTASEAARAGATVPAAARPARAPRRVFLQPVRRPVVEPAASPTWFRGPLAAAYLAPPLAFAIDGLVAGDDAIVLPVLLGLVGLSVPPLVHVAHGDASGAGYSVLGMLSGTGVGVLSGLAIGHLAPGDASRGDAQKRDALVFGFLGFLTWAVLDVTFFAYGHPRGPRSSSATVLPTFAQSANGGVAYADGLEVRVVGAL